MLGAEKYLKTQIIFTVLTKPRRFLSMEIQSQLPVKGTRSKREKAFRSMSKGITLCLVCSSPTTVLSSQNGRDLLY